MRATSRSRFPAATRAGSAGDDVMVVDLDGRAVATDARTVGRNAAAHADLPALRRRQRGAAYALARADGRLAPVRRAASSASKAGSCRRRSPDYTTHESTLDLPVFPEHAGHAASSSAKSTHGSTRASRCHGYLIDGHGIYTWGRDMPETRRHLEAFEFLLACELDLWRLRGDRHEPIDDLRRKPRRAAAVRAHRPRRHRARARRSRRALRAMGSRPSRSCRAQARTKSSPRIAPTSTA